MHRIDDAHLHAVHIHAAFPQHLLGDFGRRIDGVGRQPQDVLQGVINDINQAKEDGKLDEDRKATAHRVVIFLLIKLQKLLIELFLVICIFFLDLFHFWPESGHFDHGLLLFHSKRHQHQFGEDGKQDQRQAVVVYQVVAQKHDPPQGVTKDGVNGSHHNNRSSRSDGVLGGWSLPNIALYSKWSGTGSYPPLQKGWHLRIRLTASSPPRYAPYLDMAWYAYVEQVG